MAVSEDFEHWGERVTILASDEQDPPQNRNFYDMKVARYEDRYIGTVSVYHVLNEKWLSYHDLPPDAPPWMEKLDIQFLYSQDATNWLRAGDRNIFLSYGPEGSWDQSMVISTQPPFIVVGDEIWCYYLGTTRMHGMKRTAHDVSIGLAKLRLDGFVSVDADEEEGVLTTKAVTYTGNRLEINADARNGQVRVEIVNPFEGAISGFSREECDPLVRAI